MWCGNFSREKTRPATKKQHMLASPTVILMLCTMSAALGAVALREYQRSSERARNEAARAPKPEELATPNLGVVWQDDKVFADLVKKVRSSQLHLAVLLFSPRCGHSERMGPAFATWAEQCARKDVVIVKVFPASHTELLKQAGISSEVRGYPTLLLLRADGTEHTYQPDNDPSTFRTPPSMQKWLEAALVK